MNFNSTVHNGRISKLCLCSHFLWRIRIGITWFGVRIWTGLYLIRHPFYFVGSCSSLTWLYFYCLFKCRFDTLYWYFILRVTTSINIISVIKYFIEFLIWIVNLDVALVFLEDNNILPTRRSSWCVNKQDTKRKWK